MPIGEWFVSRYEFLALRNTQQKKTTLSFAWHIFDTRILEIIAVESFDIPAPGT